MNELQRYDLYWNPSENDKQLEDTPIGDWVLWEDVNPQLTELKRDAARYQLLRKHVVPFDLCARLGVPCEPLYGDHSGNEIERRIDELLDAELAKSVVEVDDE